MIKPRPFRMRSLSVLLAGGLFVFGTQGDAAGQRRIETATAITAQERAQGAEAHPQLLAQFGGLYDGPQAAYVVQVGRKIAVQSSLSNQQKDFTISLLNSPVNNAFAIPGGYVYVTRQLMALMNDEAELAGVLGHEIGHVAAQHSQKRQSAATRNTILGVLGQVLVGQVAGDSAFGSLLQRGIGTGAQLLTLKYSRTQEYEADDLGIRYLASAGYDPSAASTMLASLAAQTALDAQLSGSSSGVPEWASTHPDPASRVTRALESARATGSNARVRNRDVFLANVEGLIYGDDPSQGMVVDGQFKHPGLRIRFAVPTGFALSNQPDNVSLTSQSAKAQFGADRYSGDLDGYVRAVFTRLAGEQGRLPQIPMRRTTINGIPASYGSAVLTSSQGSRLSVTVIGYALSGDSACHFIVATPEGRSMGGLVETLNSLARLSEQDAALIKPRKIHLVTVRAGDTPARLAAQMAFPDRQLERFLVLNGLRSGQSLTPGEKVKIVTF